MYVSTPIIPWTHSFYSFSSCRFGFGYALCFRDTNDLTLYQLISRAEYRRFGISVIIWTRLNFRENSVTRTQKSSTNSTSLLIDNDIFLLEYSSHFYHLVQFNSFSYDSSALPWVLIQELVLQLGP